MHKQFLQQAIDLALGNVTSNKGGPYGAVIVRHNEIIAACENRVTANMDPTAHAEILAIRLACKVINNFKLADCILYTSCEPCPMCLGAIYWAKLEKVYFACSREDAKKAGFDDNFIYDEISLQPEKRKIAMFQISLPDAENPFIAWNNQVNKTPY